MSQTKSPSFCSSSREICDASSQAISDLQQARALPSRSPAFALLLRAGEENSDRNQDPLHSSVAGGCVVHLPNEVPLGPPLQDGLVRYPDETRAASIGHYDTARFLIENVKVDLSIRNYTEDDDSDDLNAASGGTALD